MSLIDIKQAITAIQNGQMIILIDDENRENEGDLVIAAEKITPDHINFMRKNAGGLICLAMDQQLIKKLQLSPMVTSNNSKFKTNFTVSIEAKNGITTGISAFDRAKTILTAVNEYSTADDLVSPGHIFPLGAVEHGVLVRAGQTEGSVDLARLANCKPATVICEIMNDDGSMARMAALEKFSQHHGIPIVSINDLIKYRLRNDQTILNKICETNLPTPYGTFQLGAYESTYNNQVHLSLTKGTIRSESPVLVRLHSECLTGDVFASMRCDCGEQLRKAMQMIQDEGTGIILYLRQEGRGIGLANKLKTYALQDTGLDTIEANHELGFDDDPRDYGIAAQMLLNLGATKIKLLTNNQNKVAALDGDGLELIKRIPLETESNLHNLKYLKTKKEKMSHLLIIPGDSNYAI